MSCSVPWVRPCARPLGLRVQLSGREPTGLTGAEHARPLSSAGYLGLLLIPMIDCVELNVDAVWEDVEILTLLGS